MNGPALKFDGLAVHRCQATERLRRFQVVGMRCSGTNFVAHLLASNTSLKWSNYLGWTHGFPSAQFIPSDLLVVVIVRDPFDWLRSLHRKPWHFHPDSRDLPFGEFLRREVNTQMDYNLWHHYSHNAIGLLPKGQMMIELARSHLLPAIKRRLGVKYPKQPRTIPDFAADRELQPDRHPLTGAPFANPIAMRTTKTQALLGYSARNCSYAIARYETVARDPQGFLERLRETFELPTDKPYSPVEEWVGEIFDRPGPVPKPDIAPADVRFILDQLDLSLEERLGYLGSIEEWSRSATA